jgi:hypothetical protein
MLPLYSPMWIMIASLFVSLSAWPCTPPEKVRHIELCPDGKTEKSSLKKSVCNDHCGHALNLTYTFVWDCEEGVPNYISIENSVEGVPAPTPCDGAVPEEGQLLTRDDENRLREELWKYEKNVGSPPEPIAPATPPEPVRTPVADVSGAVETFYGPEAKNSSNQTTGFYAWEFQLITSRPEAPLRSVEVSGPSSRTLRAQVPVWPSGERPTFDPFWKIQLLRSTLRTKASPIEPTIGEREFIRARVLERILGERWTHLLDSKGTLDAAWGTYRCERTSGGLPLLVPIAELRNPSAGQYALAIQTFSVLCSYPSENVNGSLGRQAIQSLIESIQLLPAGPQLMRLLEVPPEP